SPSAPIGLIRFASVTTGRSVPLAYITDTDAVKSLANSRSTCALACHVCATTNAGSTVHSAGGITAVPVAARLGNGGAPAVAPAAAAVPLNRYCVALDGAAEMASACSYPPSMAWSYMMPVLARTTVCGFTAHATPSRGPKLFLSVLKLCDVVSGASARPSGYR